MRGDVKDNLDKLGDFPNFSLKAIIYLYNLQHSGKGQTDNVYDDNKTEITTTAVKATVNQFFFEKSKGINNSRSRILKELVNCICILNLLV